MSESPTPESNAVSNVPVSETTNAMATAIVDAAPPTADTTQDTAASTDNTENAEPKPSYVKLAMRNMVRKGSKSLFHFGLTTAGLLGVLVGLAYLTR